MFKTTFQLFLLAWLGLGSSLAMVWADAPGDHYSVAAGHYAERRWKLAVEEFEALLAADPHHGRAARSHFFTGEALVQLGEFAKANEHFGDYLQMAAAGKYAKQATFRIGETSYLAGDVQAARGRLKAFRVKYPNDPLDAYVLAYQAEIELQAKNNSLAEQLFEQSLKNFADGPLSEDCRFGLARSQERLGKLPQAAAAYRLLAANDKGLFADAAHFRLGTIHYHNKQYAQAAKSFQTIAKTFSRSRLKTKALYWLGLSYKAQQQWAKAAETLLAAIQRDPKHKLVPAMRYHAADALLYASQHGQAIAEFDRLLVASPQSPWADDAVLGKMLAQLRIGNHQAVGSLAVQMEKLHPRSPLRAMARQTWARSLIFAKQYATAAAVLEPLIAAQAKPHGRDMERYLLGLSYHHQRRYDEALQQFGAIASNPEKTLKASLLLAHATTLSTVKRYKEAIELLKMYLATFPKGPEASGCYAELAGCYAAIGDWKLAKENHKILLSLQAPQQLTLSTSHRLAELAYRGEQKAWSVELFRLLAAEGNPPEYLSKGLSGLAWSQLRQNDISDSAATFQRLIEQYPDSPLAAEAALVRGKSLERLGKPDAAMAMYHLVIDRHETAEQLPAALLAAGLLHDQLQQQSDAIQLFSRLLKEYPDHKKTDLVVYKIAWLYRDLGDDAQADARFQQIHDAHPQSHYWPDASYRLAERAVAAKRYDQADRYLAEITAGTAGTAGKSLLAHAHYLRGQIAVTRGQWDRVAQPMRQIIEHYAESPMRLQAEYFIAEATYRKGEYDKAGLRFEQLSRKIGERGDAWLAMIPLRRAQVLAQNKKWNKAYDLAEGIAKSFPNFTQQYEVDYLLGRCHASRAEFIEARDAYRRVTQSPHGAKTETAAMAQWMIGETWFHQKLYQDAIKQYLRAEILYKYPKWQAASLLQAGKCYEHLGDWQQATAMYTKLLSKYANTMYDEKAQRRLRIVQQRADMATRSKR